MNHFIILNFIFLWLNNRSVLASKLYPLNYYETISIENIQHKIYKRSINPLNYDLSTNNQIVKEFKQIEFNAFNRKFRLILNEKKEILSENFKAYTVSEKGKKKEIKFDLDEFYEGNLVGKTNSDVTAHIEKQTGLITGSIYDDDEREAYFIEPYSNLFNNDTKDEDLMIIYRQKDMKDQKLNNDLKKKLNEQLSNSTKIFCDYININETVNDANVTRRTIRQIDNNDFWNEIKLENTKCSLRLVADYTFVEQMGNQDATKTINFIVNLISQVDAIFKRTNWTYSDSDNEPMIGFGFLITEILIHEKPYDDLNSYSNPLHYNMEKDKWKVRDLLETFSRTKSHKSFCLSHLFTHRTFENGILGLAYVSSPRQYSYGGICSQPYYKDGSFLYLNTGLTTTKNSFGHRVLTRQAVLITAHELGHNWGAEHDPSINDCSPKTKNGAYIMNTFSVSSYDLNNHFFSICSKRSIKSVLKVKAKDCFSKPKSTFCGNGIVEKGEECDPGLTSQMGDECCNKNCRLKAGSQCNDRNSPCCTNCKFSRNKICSDSNELDCKKESYCNGQSAECPKPNSSPDGIKCAEDGVCMDGECQPFCEKSGLLSCMCRSDQDACRKCCKETSNSTCKPSPVKDGNHFHRDGTICLRGFCAKGKCVNMSQDYVERFWSIIDDIEYNSFTMFLKDNLVCCVIIVSLIVFLPAWYFIEQYDLEMKKKLESEKEKSQYTSFLNRQHPSPVYGNQSSRMVITADRRNLPKNRQQFSKNIPQKFRRNEDGSIFNQNRRTRSNSASATNHQRNNSNIIASKQNSTLV